ncbi:MAG: thioredoxin family protein [Bacillota bacterium]
MREVKILGPGCPKCKTLEEEVRRVVAELNLQAEVKKVTELGEILKYGVMLTPSLVVDGRVKVSGRVPAREEIKRMLTE